MKEDAIKGQEINEFSFATDLDLLLVACLEVYYEEAYKEKYGFIDNIIEVKKDDANINELKTKVLENIMEKDENLV